MLFCAVSGNSRFVKSCCRATRAARAATIREVVAAGAGEDGGRGETLYYGRGETRRLALGEDTGFSRSRGGRSLYRRWARGRVMVVTSLADSGPGTLREACEAGGARIVVFNVAGIIELERPITIRAPYITIAGQTAPGDGVCVAGESFLIDTHDVVVRFMRFR